MERERKRMSAEDKLSNKIDDMGGKAKEAAGRLTGDDSTKNEGKVGPGEGQSERSVSYTHLTLPTILLV